MCVNSFELVFMENVDIFYWVFEIKFMTYVLYAGKLNNLMVYVNRGFTMYDIWYDYFPTEKKEEGR